MHQTELRKVLLPYRGKVLAVVGSGGKSSLLRWLAVTMPGPVWLSTSTHLGGDQTDLADMHLALKPGENLPQLPNDRTVLLTSTLDSRGMWQGLSAEQEQDLVKAARAAGATLVFEADGSRSRPLKAPAAYEPKIPLGTDLAIMVVGLSSLGHSLNEEWVHRPELFADFTGLKPGDEITAAALVRIVDAYQQKLLPKLSVFLVLNQIDTLSDIGQLPLILERFANLPGLVGFWAGSLRGL